MSKLQYYREHEEWCFISRSCKKVNEARCTSTEDLHHQLNFYLLNLLCIDMLLCNFWNMPLQERRKKNRRINFVAETMWSQESNFLPSLRRFDSSKSILISFARKLFLMHYSTCGESYKGTVLNSSTFTHHINYQMKGRDVCNENEKWKG